MILAALIFAAVVVSVWRTSSGKRPAPQPAPPSLQDRELAHLRRRYVADELSVGEFERRVRMPSTRSTPGTPSTSRSTSGETRRPGTKPHIHLP